MHSGKMVETGTTRQVLFNAENDYTRGLLAALPKLHKIGRTHF
jgi:ABC-type oligopeptide transport system ATPase subunit